MQGVDDAFEERAEGSSDPLDRQGAGDQPAGAVGNGIVRSGIVSATMGTSGVVFAHADKVVPNKAGNLQSFFHAVPGKWCVFGCMLAAGGSWAERDPRRLEVGHRQDFPEDYRGRDVGFRALREREEARK